MEIAHIKVDAPSFIDMNYKSSFALGAYEEYILQLPDEMLNAIYQIYKMDFELFGYNLSNWRK